MIGGANSSFLNAFGPAAAIGAGIALSGIAAPRSGDTSINQGGAVAGATGGKGGTGGNGGTAKIGNVSGGSAEAYSSSKSAADALIKANIK